MRKLALRILACLLILLILAGGFVVWFLKLGGGDDASAGDEDLLLAAPAVVPAEENGCVPLGAFAELLHLPGDEEGIDWPVPPAERKAGEEEAGAVDLSEYFSQMMVGKAWDDALAAAVVERNQRALERIGEVLSRPRFQVPPYDDLSKPRDYLAAARDSAYLLEFRSRSLAREGRTREAIEIALQAVRLGQRLEEGEGALLDYIIGSDTQQFGLRPLRCFASRLGPDEIRQLLAEIVKARPTDESLRKALRGEYAFFAGCIDAVAAGKLQSVQAMGLPASSEGVYEVVNEALVTSRYYFKPQRTRRLVAEAVRILLEEHEKPRAQRTQNLRSRCGVTFALDRTVSNGVGAFIAEQNIIRLNGGVKSGDDLELAFSATRVLLALRAYKVESGALPATLAELVPRFLDAVPRDPYDGQPLRYSHEKLRIWSVGVDLVDSGGGELGPDGEWSPSEEDEPTFRIE